MGKYRDRVDRQVKIAPVEEEIFEHAQREIRARLGLMLQVEDGEGDREVTIFLGDTDLHRFTRI